MTQRFFARALFLGLSAVALASLAASPLAANDSDQLVVHEWGTFTSLNDDQGRQLGGINIDDEPVPKFVHNLHRYVLASSHTLAKIQSKGVPQRHPYVTLRLETPVLYFYPPKTETDPFQVDVDVAFRGGWLTEFYPRAEASAPGLKQHSFEFGPITSQTTSTLSWHNVTVGSQATGPRTDEHVWTAPRLTQSAGLAMPNGEAEKYLFYRGVGNFNAPLSIAHDRARGELKLRGNFQDALKSDQQAKISALWLVHIKPDGATAFRRLPAVTVDNRPDRVLATANSGFAPADYSPDNLIALRAEMHKSLVADGLFGDEATAMLSTWERAYFKKPGLRVFFTVPRPWTDHYLPLTISRPADITRVMIGRVELISPEQRESLAKLSQIQVSDGQWTRKVWDSPHAGKFVSGHSDYGDLGVQIPPDYQTYLDLGRFRNALVIAECRARPTPSLRKFIDLYGLEEFDVPGESNPDRSPSPQ